jgi:integrase
MATFKAVILKGKKDIKSDGTTNIKIRITHLRKINYIPTDLYINPLQMDNKTGHVKGKNQNFINLRINDWLQKCLKSDIELGERRNLMSIAEIKSHILNDNSSSKPLDFFVFAEQLINKTKKVGTAEQYGYFVKSLQKFVGQQLPFSEINLSFLQRYETFLYNGGVKNGVINYMITFRAIFNKARDFHNDEDINIIPIPHYPFRHYKIPKRKVKSKNHVLSIDEMHLFMNYKPSNPAEEFAKDLFLLMFYLIGIESIDLFNLKPAEKGRVFYDRYKTGRLYSIKLEPEAINIIKKYPSNTHLINVSDRFKLSKSFLHFINNYLHGENYHKIVGISQKTGINKPITSKWAKHTWATIARNECRINKDDVALCLGHEDADNQVTDMYVKYDYSIIDDSNRKVIDFVNSHGTSLDVPLDNK